MGTQPVYPSFGGNMTTQQSGMGGGGGSTWDWLGPLLNFGGNLIGGAASGKNDAAARDLQAQEFGQQMDFQRTMAMLPVSQMLNRAPLADKAQYLALNMSAPQTFQPRDYTRGMDQLRGQPTGGAAAQMAANNTAQMNYRPGAGGVDTSTMDLVMRRLGAPSSPNAATNTTNYGGKQYTAQEWSQYLNDHPEVARQQNAGRGG